MNMQIPEWFAVDLAAVSQTRRCDGPGCETVVHRTAPSGLCEKCLAVVVERQREEVFTRAGPEVHRAACFGPDLTAWCKDPSALRWAAAVGERGPDCGIVTFWGTTGAGKSTLAAATLRALLAGPRKHATVLWTDARDLARARRQHKLGRGEPPEIVAAIDADLLVIDEIGKETGIRDANPEDVVMVLDERYRVRRGRMTMITTEWAARPDVGGVKLADIYMPSLVRRLTEPYRAGPPPVGSAIVIQVRREDEIKVAA